MSEDNDTSELLVKPEETEFKKTSFSRTLYSLAFFIMADYWIFKSWFSVLLLVSVIFIHELGHFIAMKIYGYQTVNMTFVPFVGAYVSGKASNLSRKNKLVVLLAGPVPGIIIGCTLLFLHQQNFSYFYFQLAFLFLSLNVFNLLPVFPLDGGQFFQTLFFNGSKIIQLFFLYVSLAVMVYLFFKLNYSWWLLIVVAFVSLRIINLHRVYKVRRQLDKEGVDYACSYDDLTDAEYWQIRNVLINNNRALRQKFSTDFQSADENLIIRHVESVLVPAYADDLTTAGKIIFTLVWAAAFAIPVLQWMQYRGYW